MPNCTYIFYMQAIERPFPKISHVGFMQTTWGKKYKWRGSVIRHEYYTITIKLYGKCHINQDGMKQHVYDTDNIYSDREKYIRTPHVSDTTCYTPFNATVLLKSQLHLSVRITFFVWHKSSFWFYWRRGWFSLRLFL